VLPILISLFVAMIPLFYQAYNPNGFAICSIAELECTQHQLVNVTLFDSYTTCERHREEVWDLSYFRFTCICMGNLAIVVSVIILVQHVRSREERMNRNSGDNICCGFYVFLGSMVHMAGKLKSDYRKDFPSYFVNCDLSRVSV
jgi:hypothetical protein